MADFENDDNSLKAKENYGFKANIRHKVTDIIYRNDFLEKIGIPYAISIKGVLLLLSGAIPITLAITFLIRDFTRAKFVGLGVIGLTVSICIILFLASFLMPSYGTLLRSSFTFIYQIVKRILIKTGLKKPERTTNFSPVRKDGVILKTFGEYGRLFKIDGRASRTAYPSEIVELEKITGSYHSGRLTSTTEFHITISQRQNTERQLENLETLANSTNKKANYDLLNIEHMSLSNYVHGVKPVSEHYLLLINPSEIKLNESIERLMHYTQVYNMYNSATPLSKEETEKFFNDFFKFR